MLLMVSHVDYVPHVLLSLETDRWDRQTDGRTPDRYITLTARRGLYNNMNTDMINDLLDRQSYYSTYRRRVVKSADIDGTRCYYCRLVCRCRCWCCGNQVHCIPAP